MKNVYIIGSEHESEEDKYFEDKVKERTKKTVVIYKELCEVIGREMNITSYFSDGITESSVENINLILDELASMPSSKVPGFCEYMFNYNPRLNNQGFATLINLANLKRSGQSIRVKTTEVNYYKEDMRLIEEVAPGYFRLLLHGDVTQEEFIKSWKDKSALEVYQEIQKEKKDLIKFGDWENIDLPKLSIERRDFYIHQNLKKLAKTHSLLGIGLEHRLQSLCEDQKIKVYRIDINKFDFSGPSDTPHVLIEENVVFGSLPIKSKKAVSSYLKKKNLREEIKYLTF